MIDTSTNKGKLQQVARLLKDAQQLLLKLEYPDRDEQLGQFGGFQVHAVGDEQKVLFESMLYGGARLVGDAREVQEGSRNYVHSRRRGRAKGAA